MRLALFDEQPNPKWTDETLPFEVRKQILADELRRVSRVTQRPGAGEQTRKTAAAQYTEHAT